VESKIGCATYLFDWVGLLSLVFLIVYFTSTFLAFIFELELALFVLLIFVLILLELFFVSC